eukprot:6489620-Amphidinium_carterae.1
MDSNPTADSHTYGIQRATQCGLALSLRVSLDFSHHSTRVVCHLCNIPARIERIFKVMRPPPLT